MTLIPVDDALRLVLGGVERIGDTERVSLPAAHDRVLAEPVMATRDQPPFAASAMDGYAVRSEDVEPGGPLRIVGESVAGRRFEGAVGAGEAIRIFTGAPMPEGADAVLIQEDAARDEDVVTPAAAVERGRYVRSAGLDFVAGDRLVEPGDVLDAGRLALAAAANMAKVSVIARPRVAILATGDELVPLGGMPGPDQIVASSVHAVIAILQSAGAEAIDAGIAPDRSDALDAMLDAIVERDPHLVVTLGGASVGEHDLVAEALERRGVSMKFERVAMRPGKPLMHGRGDARLWLGLPGNPVSSMVCAHLFAAPLVARLAGRTHHRRWVSASVASDLPENDMRQDYLRVALRGRDPIVAQLGDRQDSSQISRFAAADGLLVRPPHAPAAAAGTRHDVLALRDWD